MRCPGCHDEMKRMTLEAVLGQTVDVDVCAACRAFWFEPFETLHLTPASTLQLFQMIADAPRGGTSPTPSRCPKCQSPLLLTHDRQRTMAFQYWRCDREHGRFTPFTDFLKEKNFIRPLTAQRIAELRRSVKTVHCANCGGPVDVVMNSVCGHCGSPLAILDPDAMGELAREYREAESKRLTRPLPPLPHNHGSSSWSPIDVDDLANWLIDLVSFRW